MKLSTAPEFDWSLISAQAGWRQKILYILFIHVEKNLNNMDAQDAQDSQDGRLPRKRLTPAMIACGFADVQDCKRTVSRKNPVNPVHPVHRCE